jgi:hypothetical protein
MPTTRRLRIRSRREAIDPAHWAILTDEMVPADANRFTVLDAESYDVMRLLWEDHRAGILADWIKLKPGTRPAMWWRYDAPRLDPEKHGRWSRTVLAPRLIETRRKLCGEGMPLHEALNFAPAHHYGIPAWFGDPDNPPAFESQRVYLKRHGLLLPAERRQIPEPVRYPLRIEAARRWK